MAKLASEICIKDLGPLIYFLGIIVAGTTTSLFHSQKKYVAKILNKAIMLTCKCALTLVTTTGKLSAKSDAPFENPTLYRCLGSSLQYFIFTRPNMSYVVEQVCFSYMNHT